MLKLTNENYFSDEANWDYMSASQYKAFKRCEAAAMAELRGEWSRKDSTALLVGGYIDAIISNELPQFTQSRPQMFKKDGSLKAEYIAAERAAQILLGDDLSRRLLSGKHQIIKTGKIAGVWFKCKMDSLLTASQVRAICDRYPEMRRVAPFDSPMIVDLKYMRDFEDIWDEDLREKVSFAEYWGYDIQGAIYQALDNRQAPFVIVGVTKQDVPDHDAFYIPGTDLDEQLADVEAMAPRYAAIKRGEIPAERCGKCPYCRATKRLIGARHYKYEEVIADAD